MNTRIVAGTGSTATQSSEGVSSHEIFREARAGLAVVLGVLLSLLAWSYFPDTMEIISIAVGVLIFVYLVSELAVRFGPSHEAVVAMSLSSRELRAEIRGY